MIKTTRQVSDMTAKQTLLDVPARAAIYLRMAPRSRIFCGGVKVQICKRGMQMESFILISQHSTLIYFIILSLGNLPFLLQQHFQGGAFGQVRPPQDDLKEGEGLLHVPRQEVGVPREDDETHLVEPLDDREVSPYVVRHVVKLDADLEHVGQRVAEINEALAPITHKDK